MLMKSLKFEVVMQLQSNILFYIYFLVKIYIVLYLAHENRHKKLGKFHFVSLIFTL